MKIVKNAAVQILLDFHPELGLILGSGLGEMADKIKDPVYVNYCDIPGLPISQVEGHENRFVLGTLKGKKVITMQGRVHYYEGIRQSDLALPIRLMKLAGVKTLLLTNAAGGVNTTFKPGDIMLISDHINLSGSNPLIGPNDPDFGPRFPDMSDIYTASLRAKIRHLADEEGTPLKEGVYVMYSGPSYETPAEIRMIRTLGGDAVGMSTVPEAILARHCGMQVIGITCVTNMAAGILPRKLSHQEVLDSAEKTAPMLEKLVGGIIEKVC